MQPKLLIVLLYLLHSFGLYSQVDIESYPDNSWDAETYNYLGIPSIKKEWKAAELKQFVKYMKKIYDADKWSLPRKDSPYSGDVFSKMTSFELIEPINDATISLEQRIDYINVQLEYSNFLVGIYKEGNKETERFAKEVLVGYDFLLTSSIQVRIFIDELTKTLPANATAQPEFKKMYNQSTSQVVAMMDLHIQTLQEEWARYGRMNISDFTSISFESISKGWTLLSGEQQKTLLDKILPLKKHEVKVVRKETKAFFKKYKKE